MLREVTRPDKSCVSFQYDTFGRRIEKSVTSIHSKGASEGRQQKLGKERKKEEMKEWREGGGKAAKSNKIPVEWKQLVS